MFASHPAQQTHIGHTRHFYSTFPYSAFSALLWDHYDYQIFSSHFLKRGNPINTFKVSSHISLLLFLLPQSPIKANLYKMLSGQTCSFQLNSSHFLLNPPQSWFHSHHACKAVNKKTNSQLSCDSNINIWCNQALKQFFSPFGFQETPGVPAFVSQSAFLISPLVLWPPNAGKPQDCLPFTLKPLVTLPNFMASDFHLQPEPFLWIPECHIQLLSQYFYSDV